MRIVDYSIADCGFGINEERILNLFFLIKFAIEISSLFQAEKFIIIIEEIL